MLSPPIKVAPKCLLYIAIIVAFTNGSEGRAGANPSERFRFAYVQSGCGPTDGAALFFYFTTKQSMNEKVEEPFISISINQDLPKSAPLEYLIRRGRTPIQGMRCSKAGECVSATSGFLRLTRYTEGKVAVGEYDLHFPDGSVERGSFDATWRFVKFVCG
jgi:hypothetical protein